MVLVQKWPYFQLFFFREYRPGKCLLRYSRTKKTPFQAIKTRSSKSRKIDISPKGLTHGFGPKMGIFVTFFWGNIGQENVFFDILKRKNAFVGYKNNKFKKSKNWHIFSTFFFFRQYRPGKCVLRYSRTKKRQIRSSKSKIWHFSKGINP